MFSSKKALSAFSSKTLPLAIVAVAAGILGLVWLGSDTAEARGRSITLTRNVITTPNAETAAADGGGNAPCLQSLVEWEPIGSKVQVEITLFRRANGSQLPPGTTPTWQRIDTSTQLLPGKATSATVDWPDWPDVTPGDQYRHLFQAYTVKGKGGASRNRQLASGYSNPTPYFASCGV